MTDTDLSRAIVAYVGYGSLLTPHFDPAAFSVLELPDRTDLLRRVEERIVDLYSAYPYTWNGNLELSEVGELLTAELMTRYEDLTEEAIKAIVWKWTYEAWK